MNRPRIVSLLVLLAAPLSIRPALHAQAATRDLESFFVTFADYRILHVRPVASGVSVRSIQMLYLEERCWTRVMRAYEVTLPNMTVQQLAATAICALTQERVDAALDKSRENFIRSRDGIPWPSTYFDSVVGVCNGRERRLIFDYGGKNAGKPDIDERKLRRVDRRRIAQGAGGQLEATYAQGGRGRSECLTECHTCVTRPLKKWRARQVSNLRPSA